MIGTTRRSSVIGLAIQSLRFVLGACVVYSRGVVGTQQWWRRVPQKGAAGAATWRAQRPDCLLSSPPRSASFPIAHRGLKTTRWPPVSSSVSIASSEKYICVTPMSSSVGPKSESKTFLGR